MRLSAIMLFMCLCASSALLGQEINLSVRNESLETIFSRLEKQSGYTFFYKIELIKTLPKVTAEIKHATLQKALDLCLRNEPLSYSFIQKTVVIKSRNEPAGNAGPGTQAAPGTILVRGRVVDNNGQGLPAVTIRLKGTRYAWATDQEGNFVGVLMDKEGGTNKVLVFSSVGYAPQEQPVAVPGKFMLVGLKQSISNLDEVQLTAYSKTSERYNTGDITTVTAEEIARNPVDNVLEALQGRVAGMQVEQLTGETNGAYKVQIRSLNTLGGSYTGSPQTQNSFAGQPLYIVDGVEYPSGGILPMVGLVAGQENTLENGNALNYLDPSQIESVNVLKGADATAIYGSRGAFGVILITTKRAKAGKPSLSVNVVQGFSEVGPTPKLLNNQQYLALRHSAFAYDNATPGTTDWDLNGVWDTTKSTNWQKFYISGRGPKTRASANYTGGTENSNFLIGANYSDQGNVELDKGGVKQGGLNFALHTGTKDRKFSMNLSGSYSVNTDNRVPVDFDSPTFLDQAPDAQTPYLPNGQLNWANGYNQVAILNTIYKNTTDNLLAGTTITYSPIKGLNLIASGGFNELSGREFSGQPSTVFNPLTFISTDTYSFLNTYTIRTLSADPRIEYEHTFWKKGVLDVITGGSVRDKLTTTEYLQGSAFLNDALLLDPASASQANLGASYSTAPDRYTGVFAQVKYRWADKYLLDLNGRRDGSSLFGNDRQFGNFGSVGGGWIISEEPWFKSLRSAVDFLKLKGSYGLVGGNSLQPFSYLSLFQVTTNTYEGGNSLTPATLSNPYLHWETDKNAEGGITFDLFKGRLNVDAMYYSDHVSNQLGPQALASITGFTSVTVNLPADVHTYGLEISLFSHNIHTRNFTWDTKLNFTAPRSKLLSYPGLGSLVNNINWKIGKPITGVELYKYAGVDPATGVYNFYDSAGVKGEYTPILSPTQLNPISDKTQFVDLAPKFYGGILNNIGYKNFSMDFLISVTDKTGPNYQGFQSFPMGQFNTNAPADLAAKRWMKPGDKTDVPAATQSFLGLLDQYNFITSTGAFSNATYARLQNLSISYRFPANIIRHAGASLISIYVSGQNLLTVSKYGDLDPENMSAGHMPPLRVFTGGLNATF